MGKTRYIIHYTGLFQEGHVTIAWTGRDNELVRRESFADSEKHATKFRFKFMADIYCWMCQKSSDMNFELRTFKVRECKLPTHAKRWDGL
jgi:hypothetical protein